LQWPSLTPRSVLRALTPLLTAHSTAPGQVWGSLCNNNVDLNILI
jgi:hypothetical protein